jgi:tetratricopeptide (TPR) repeat protein
MQEHPTNPTIVKRLAALERSRGEGAKAIAALVKHLEVFANDSEAWEELAELYLEGCQYRQALHCMEELALSTAPSVGSLCRYAATLYTLGGPQNCRTARAYYAKAVQLSGGGSLRALLGVLACGAQLADRKAAAGTVPPSSAAAAAELPAAAAQAVADLYGDSAPEKLPAVHALLAKLAPRGGGVPS